jgi:hypothetical protein
MVMKSVPVGYVRAPGGPSLAGVLLPAAPTAYFLWLVASSGADAGAVPLFAAFGLGATLQRWRAWSAR